MPDPTYIHPRLGPGTLISQQPDGTRVYKFEQPPGMNTDPGPHIVPTLVVREAPHDPA